MKQYSSYLYKISSLLWTIWGFVHAAAGFMTIKSSLSGEVGTAISKIADKMDPADFQMQYPEALSGLIAQHGFNLLWIGLITFVAGFAVWKGRKSAIILAALVGGFADLGYFLFMDLGGFVNFVPGTIMTIFSLTAIITSFTACYFERKK